MRIILSSIIYKYTRIKPRIKD